MSDKNSVANDGGSTFGVGVIVGSSVGVDGGIGVSVDCIVVCEGVGGTGVEAGVQELNKMTRTISNADAAVFFMTSTPLDAIARRCRLTASR